jgi:iron complex outermembrane receptor protein
MIRGKNNVRFISVLLAAGSALAGASLQAQTTPASAVNENENGGLDEIVVTAQRRDENLQTVPIAVAAVNAETLKTFGVASTDSLQVAVPGLELNRISGTGTSAFLRGVGANQANPGSEPPVAMYVDDVYLGAPQADFLSLANIEQVEVLKGPQGTLFGRNATGGLINIHTKRPSHDASGDARLSYSRFNTLEGSAYLTGPLSDTLAANLSFYGMNQGDGYGRNVTRNEDIFKGWAWNVRGSLLWEPSSDTKVLVSSDAGDHYDRREILPAPGTISSGGATNQGKFLAFNSAPVATKFPAWGVSARVEQELGFAKLLSITAYRQFEEHTVFDQDLAPVDVVTVNIGTITRNFSQELQLQSNKGGPLTWILGVYYFRSKTNIDPQTLSGAAAGAAISTTLRDQQILNSYSGFGELTYEFLPDTRLTLGARYTTDKYSLAVQPRTAASGAVIGAGFDAQATFSEPTYRAILDHRFTPDVMAYISYSRGFKSGGYNVPGPGNFSAATPNGDPPVKPEKIDAYEIGLKTQFFDNRVRFNVAAFKYKYQDIQVVNSATGASVIVNAAEANIEGVDFDATFAPTANLTFTFGGAFLNSKYGSFPFGPSFIPRPAVCTPTPANTGPVTGGNLRCNVDLSGNQLSRSPKFTGTIGVNYRLPTDVGDFTFNGSLYHNSGFFWEAGNHLRQNSYELLNGSITWRSKSGGMELGIFGKNLTNAYYYSYGAESTFAYGVSPAQPRTYGVTAAVHF